MKFFLFFFEIVGVPLRVGVAQKVSRRSADGTGVPLIPGFLFREGVGGGGYPSKHSNHPHKIISGPPLKPLSITYKDIKNEKISNLP